VHARHGKAVPGHQPDARDRAWLAALRRHGWLQASVSPPRPLRALRALPRYRQRVRRDQSAVATRLQQVSERGNRKLGQVARAAPGGRGRARLRAWAAGETEATTRADWARKPLQRQKPA
jgi:transposase